MDYLILFHSYFRYVVLVAAVIALVVALMGAFGSGVGALGSMLMLRRTGTLYVTALDVQLLVGIIMYVMGGYYTAPGFFRAEHPATMVLAIVAAHIGQARAKKAVLPRTAARTLAITFAVSLVLVLIGIPGIVRAR